MPDRDLWSRFYALAIVAQLIYLLNHPSRRLLRGSWTTRLIIVAVACTNSCFAAYITAHLCMHYNLDQHITLSIIALASYGGGRTLEAFLGHLERNLKGGD